MRTSKVRFRWNLLNLLASAVTPGILPGNARYGELKGGEAWRGQLRCEGVVVWAVKVGLLALDWRKALCLVLVPQLLANLGIVGINFLWHDGCDPDHPFNHSRNFTGRFLNFVALNNGYHGMHHEEPALHWSLLPRGTRTAHPSRAASGARATVPAHLPVADLRLSRPARDIRRQASRLPGDRLRPGLGRSRAKRRFQGCVTGPPNA